MTTSISLTSEEADILVKEYPILAKIFPEHFCAFGTKEGQLAAIKRGGCNIKYIHNPSTELQLAAIRQNRRAFFCIKNRSIITQFAAFKDSLSGLSYHDDNKLLNCVTLEVQCHLIKTFKYNFYKILEKMKGPNEFLQLFYIKQFPISDFRNHSINGLHPNVVKYIQSELDKFDEQQTTNEFD